MRHIRKQKNSVWQRRSRAFSCRYPRKSKGNKKALALCLMPILIIIACLYFFFFSEFFKIKDIEISGTNKIDREAVKSLASEEIRKKGSCYISGENYFILNEGKVDQKILEKFPQAKTIKTRKKFPNSLIIQIEEKESALIWCRKSCFFVNPQGVAFMEANEEQLVQENQSFIKIVEETGVEKGIEMQSETAENEEKTKITTEEEGLVIGEQKDTMQSLVEIKINDRVSDDNFIKSAIDINEKISYNSKLKVKFYKTGGTKTRELIAFTDKNTMIYFDTTKDLDAQIKNLNYFLNKELEQNQIDTLQYIYLKNQDRIFYK